MNDISFCKWQQFIKPIDELIVQASTMDGCDGLTAASIGMSFGFVNCNYLETFINNNNNRNNLVLCAVSELTDQRRRGMQQINRQNICRTLCNNGIYNQTLTSDNYFKALSSYKFVISPEGNGIDCHRHYEALISGCIPIIEDNPIIRAKYGNVPILWTTDYSEITEQYLLEQYETIKQKRWDFSKLFLSYWSPEEQQLIKYRGNFWCKRLTGKIWYV